MRVVVVVIAALMTLGLAAFGVVAAQKAAGPASLVALAARIISPAQNCNAPTPPAATSRRPSRASLQTPVMQISDRVADADAGAARPTPRAQPRSVAQNPAPAPAPARPAPRSAAAAKGIPACSNPNALGLSRIVEIDTTGGPAFGTEHFKQYDFLRDKEVVLTFDDGPWPDNTPMVLKALTDNCIKATFFEIGEHATWRPDLQDGGRRRHDGRQPHLVAQGSGQEPLCQGYRAGQARDRDGRERRAHGGRRTDRAVLPLPRSAAAAGSDRPISARATSRRSRPTSTPSTSRSTSPTRSSNR